MGWYRVKFPRNIIQLCHHARTSHQQRHNKFVFRIPPHMGKTELKNILTSLYDLQVKKINTANYDGAFYARRWRAGLWRGHLRSQRRRRALLRAAERLRRMRAGRAASRTLTTARSPLFRPSPFLLVLYTLCLPPPPSLSLSLSLSLSPLPIAFVPAGLIKRSAGNVYKDKDYKRAVVTLIPKFEGDTMGWPENYT